MQPASRYVLPALACATSVLATAGAHAVVQIQRSVTVRTPAPSAVAVADFNHDGLADLAVASTSEDAVRVYFGKPSGSFSEPVVLATGPGTDPSLILAADLRGAGDPDIAVVLHGVGALVTFKNDGRGVFSPGLSVPVGADASALITANVQAIGVPTLIVADRASGVLTLARATAGPSDRVVTVPSGVREPIGIAAGDFTRDGTMDLGVIGAGGGNVQILKGDGRSGFAASAALNLPGGTVPSAITSGPIAPGGADGILVTLADSTQGNIALYTDTTNSAAPPKMLKSAGSRAADCAIVDIDRDQRPDIVVINSATRTLSILRSTQGTASAFESPALFQLGGQPGHFAWAKISEQQPIVIAAPSIEGGMVTVLTPAGAARCIADFNNSGSSTVEDVFAFVSAWFAHDAGADVDGRAGLDIRDIFAFLTAWFAGC